MRQGPTQGLCEGLSFEARVTRQNRRSQALTLHDQGLKGAQIEESPLVGTYGLAAQQSKKSAPSSPCESSHVD